MKQHQTRMFKRVLTLPELGQKAAVCVQKQPFSAEDEEQVTTLSLFSVILSPHRHPVRPLLHPWVFTVLSRTNLSRVQNCLVWTFATPEVRHCLWRWVTDKQVAITAHQLTCAIEGTGPLRPQSTTAAKGASLQKSSGNSYSKAGKQKGRSQTVRRLY